MPTGILIGWLLTSALLLWGVSLFLRAVSEWRAWRRADMKPEHAKWAGWGGFGLAVMCVAAACGVGWWLLWVESKEPFGWGDTHWTPIPMRWVWSGVLLVGTIWIWAWTGDRSRGRTRCRRCWYDLSANTGDRCPECGTEVKNQRQTARPKRRRKTLALASLLLAGLGYVLWHTPRVDRDGWLVLVPTRVLMWGWDVWPEAWIWDGAADAYESCLEYRLRWELEPQRDFARWLMKPMLTSRTERWNPKRIELIQGSVGSADSGSSGYSPFFSASTNRTPNDSHFDELLDLVAMDHIQLITSPDSFDGGAHLEERIRQGKSYLLFRDMAIHDLTQIATSLHPDDSDAATESVRSHLVSLLPETRAHWSAHFDLDIIAPEARMDDVLKYVSLDTGLLGEFATDFLILDQTTPHRRRFDLAFALFMAISDLAPERQTEIWTLIHAWAVGSDPIERCIAFYFTSNHFSMLWPRSRSPHPLADRILQVALESGIYDTRTPIDPAGDPAYDSVRGGAFKLIDAWDDSKTVSFPLAARLLDDGVLVDLGFSQQAIYTDSESREQWKSHFTRFATDPRAEMREWFVMNAPDKDDRELYELVTKTLHSLVGDPDVRSPFYIQRELDSRATHPPSWPEN